MLKKIIKEVRDLIVLLISMAGYVPKSATVTRTIIMIASVLFAVYLQNRQPANTDLAIIYFIICEVMYVGFISVSLSEKGLRHWFIRKWGNEDEGYRAFETVLGFLFFHNALGIGYVASSCSGNMFGFIDKWLLMIIVAFLFFGGFLIKIFSAKAVTIDIYYWKDMFLGRKITEFVVTGPYKYFSNPMYGIGQIQAYATAIYYGSKYGLLAAFINQCLIFTFYYLVEKKFINRIYLKQTA